MLLKRKRKARKLSKEQKRKVLEHQIAVVEEAFAARVPLTTRITNTIVKSYDRAVQFGRNTTDFVVNTFINTVRLCFLPFGMLFTTASNSSIFIIMYFYSILSFSLSKMARSGEKSVNYQDELFDRVVMLEEELRLMRKSYMKLNNKLKQAGKATKVVERKVIVTKIQTATGAPAAHIPSPVKMAPIIPIMPALPPPPPPPAFSLQPKKLTIPRSKSKEQINPAIKKNPAAANLQVSLDTLLKQRGNLRSTARSPRKNNSLPQPAPLQDITTISLRRANKRSSNNVPSPNNNTNAPKTPVRKNALFRLKNTGVLRSPGGTPMKENFESNTDSPANILTNALLLKFKNAHGSPRNSNTDVTYISPYQSPIGVY